MSGDKKKKELRKKLGLQNHYSTKIKFDDVVAIQKDDKTKSDLTALPWIILRKIIMLDSTGRDDVVQSHFSSKGGGSNSLTAFMAKLSASQSAKEELCPLDIFILLYECCDLLLKQTLLQKMFLCKHALPIISTDKATVLSLWSLRGITLSNRCDDGSVKETSAVKLPCHRVSLIRLGDTSFSKSNLLNEVINDNTHKIFHDRNSPGATKNRYLSSGSVEGIFFAKETLKQSHLKHPVLYMNLRRDACNSKVARILYKISSAVIVCTDFENLASGDNMDELERAHRLSTNIILVIASKATPPDENIARRVLQKYQSKIGEEQFDSLEKVLAISNIADTRSAIRAALERVLNGCTKESYEEIVHRIKTERLGESDEDHDGDCRNGEAWAFDVFNHVKDMARIHEHRHKLIPLQGEFWLEWSRCLMRERHLNTEATFLDKDEIKTKMNSLRQRQCDKLKRPMSLFVFSFFTCLLQNQKKGRSIDFFLKCLKLLLEEKSQERIPELRERRTECWEKLNKAKNGENQEEIESLRIAFNTADRNLSNEQLTLDHILREIGQMYEAFSFNKRDIAVNMTEHLNRLPDIFASLLLSGHGLEIMDGDAFNIPTTWVSAVLKAISKRIGNKNILVISVLGVQSSGKSTLLKAMFGIQLETRAGRCTKGVSVRFVPIVRKGRLNFDYALIVDIEGLRSTEPAHEGRNRDSQLATLALGLADITAIVIKGENTADIKEILQIAAHAFIRMKSTKPKMKLHQKCCFIHNNVSAQNAKQEIELAQQHLVETLDKLIREATHEEGYCAVKSFKEVIDFDAGADVFYVPDLWKGNPPMASVSPAYTEKISEIKEYLLNVAGNLRMSLTVSNISDRISDLWAAILADDFIFSFRSTLEAKAYKALERKFVELFFALEKEIISWLNDNAEVKIQSCNSEQELSICASELSDLLHALVENLAQTARQELIDFCQNDSLHEYLQQWKENKVLTLSLRIQTFKHKQQVEIINLESSRKFDIKTREHERSLENYMLQMSRSLAEHYRGVDITMADVQQTWNQMWDKWVSDRELGVPQANVDPIHIVMKKILLEIFIEYNSIVEEELEESPIQLSVLDYMQLEGAIKTKEIKQGVHIQLKESSPFSLFKRKDAVVKNAKAILNGILHEVNTEINIQRRQAVGFKPLYVKSVLKIIVNALEEHNKREEHKFMFTPKLQVELVVECCRHTYRLYSEMQKTREEQSGIQGKLNRVKPLACKYFMNRVDQSQRELSAAEKFWDTMKVLIISRVEQLIPMQMVWDLQRDFSYTKDRLIVEILRSLLQDNSFDKYMRYVTDARAYALECLTQYVQLHWFTLQSGMVRTKYAEVARNKTYDILERILRCLPNTEDRLFPQDNIDAWVGLFCDQVRNSNQLPINEDSLHRVARSGITNVTIFAQEILNHVDEFKQYATEYFEKQEGYPLDSHISPEREILNRLWGCSKQCPFCREPCKETNADHSEYAHTCVQHKPSGILGLRWPTNNKLVLQSCNFFVQSNFNFNCDVLQGMCCEMGIGHPFREYKKFLPQWDIVPCTEPDYSTYWCYFMVKYHGELASWYLCEAPDIPYSWRRITEADALRSIERMLE